MRMPYKKDYEDILRYFGQNPNDRYNFKYRFNKLNVMEYAFKNYIKISKPIFKSGQLLLENVPNKKEMLKKFFDTRYSVNELVRVC